jgi:outer membrane immunogenic protein
MLQSCHKPVLNDLRRRIWYQLLAGWLLFRQRILKSSPYFLEASVKRFAIALLAVISLSVGASQSASAADLPLKAPPMVAAPLPWSWTGLYLGGNIGYSWGQAGSVTTLNGAQVFSDSLNVDGIIGGGQIGYNWQASNFVFGIEADIQGSGQKGDKSVSFLIPVPNAGLALETASFQSKLTDFGTVRGRAGYAVNQWLLYVTGGWAYGHETLDGTATVLGVTAPFSYSTNRSGWTLGGGVEMAINRNWSWKAEYIHLDLGSWNITTVSALGTSVETVKFTDDIFRLGVNYRF